MVELKDRQQQGTEGELQVRSRLLLMHVCIFASLQLEGSGVGDLLYMSSSAHLVRLIKLSYFIVRKFVKLPGITATVVALPVDPWNKIHFAPCVTVFNRFSFIHCSAISA